jgi:hypothetical protein
LSPAQFAEFLATDAKAPAGEIGRLEGRVKPMLNPSQLAIVKERYAASEVR